MVIKLECTKEEIAWAKEETKKFDAQKDYDKFTFSENWIGVLGEKKLNQWQEKHNLGWTWVKFVKTGTSSEDFFTPGKKATIDIKTSWSPTLKITNTKFKYYILATFDEEQSCIKLIAWQNQKILSKRINHDKSLKMERDDGGYYYKLRPFENRNMNQINEQQFIDEAMKW